MDLIVAISHWFLKVIQENWQALVSAFIGTFVGAYTAFHLERKNAEKNEKIKNVSAAKQMQYILWSMYNFSLGIEKQVLGEYRELKDRHLMIKPIAVFVNIPSIDSVSLSFMLEGDGANLLGHIMIAEQHFRTMLGALECRNIRYEAMQQSASKDPSYCPDIATRSALLDFTNTIYEENDIARSELKDAFGKVKTYIEGRYPPFKALALEDKAEKLVLK